LKKLSEDILNNYAREEAGTEWDAYPEHVQRLLRSLELDGFIIRDGRLLASETNVLAEEEELGVLESLFRSLGLQNEQTAFHHLDLSEQHYLAGRWDDSISNSRKFLESVLQEVADAYNIQRYHTPLPQNTYERPIKIRDYLENEDLISSKEKEALIKVYGLLSDTGGHPYMARSDQARLLRNLALTQSQFIMLRLQGISSGL
jgi:hypothetical protein